MHDFETKRCLTCDKLQLKKEETLGQLEVVLDTQHSEAAPTSDQLEAAGDLLQGLVNEENQTEKDLLELDVEVIQQAEEVVKQEALLDHGQTPDLAENLEKAVDILEEQKKTVLAEIAEPAEPLPDKASLLKSFEAGLQEEQNKENFQENLMNYKCDQACQAHREQTDRLLDKLAQSTKTNDAAVDELEIQSTKTNDAAVDPVDELEMLFKEKLTVRSGQ